MVRREDMKQSCNKHKWEGYGQCFQCVKEQIEKSESQAYGNDCPTGKCEI